MGGAEYTVLRSRLGGFLRMQRADLDLAKAVGERHSQRMADALLAYLRVSIPDLEIDDIPWFEVVMAYADVRDMNQIPGVDDFAMLRNPPVSTPGAQPPAYDHPGRVLVTWVHVIARSYHWSRDDIESLWPEDALSFIQEILLDEFHEREFLYSLSENAYQYDKSAKVSRYRPMQKPAWMVVRSNKDPMPTTKILKELMPAGVVKRFEEYQH